MWRADETQDNGCFRGGHTLDELLVGCHTALQLITAWLLVLSRKMVLVQTRFFRSNLGRLEHLMEAEQVVVNITARFSCHRMSGGVASLSEDV